MLSRETNVFLQTREEFAERILHPGEIAEVNESGYTADLVEPLALEVGQDVHIYYEIERQFMQQPARITAVRPFEGEPSDEDVQADDRPAPALVVGFEITGGLISAECRECYRVSTVTAALTASLGAEERCALTDVSATGFSVIATDRHSIGTVVPATLRYEDRQFTGKACVQSIKELLSGDIRYGLQSIKSRGRSPDLEQGQQYIGMTIQRQQLRRRSGAA